MEKTGALADQLTERHKRHLLPRVFTVAVSGIDGAGKGFIAGLLQAELEKRGYNTALIHTDPWQHPLGQRLREEEPALHIYENIFRWDDFFGQLVVPLQRHKKIYLETKGIRTDADIYYPLLYDYHDIDILLIEGILLLKRNLRHFYDCALWIDCSFETGLRRALLRNAENRAKEELLHDYHKYYYAAQRLHFEMDQPRETADLVFDNEQTLPMQLH